MSLEPPLRRGHSLLVALQLGDSLLPFGRFVHSYGIEAWFESNANSGEDQLVEVIESTLVDGIGPLDCVVLAHAHAATSAMTLARLDALLTARKLTPGTRLASLSCGRQLAALAKRLVDHPLVDEFCLLVRTGKSAGNLVVVEGMLARALGLPVEDAVLVELRGTAVACLSAAVRLGRLSAGRSQVILRRLEPTILRAADDALSTELADLRSTVPELEIFAMAHPRIDGRLFAT